MTAPLQPAFLAPQPPSYLSLAPLAPVGRGDQLTGERLSIYRALLVTVLVSGVIGALASVSTGYEVYSNGSQELLSSRPAGSSGSALWSLVAVALAGLGLRRPTRRTAQRVGLGLVALFFIGTLVTLATLDLFNLDDLSFSKHTVETGAADALSLAVGVIALAGPVLLIAQWILFRLERRRA